MKRKIQKRSNERRNFDDDDDNNNNTLFDFFAILFQMYNKHDRAMTWLSI
jgi:hypothetical protein